MTCSDVVKWAKELNEWRTWCYYINDNTPIIQKCRELTVEWLNIEKDITVKHNSAEVTKVVYTAISLLTPNLYNRFSEGAKEGARSHAVKEPTVMTPAQKRLYDTLKGTLPHTLKVDLWSNSFPNLLRDHCCIYFAESFEALGTRPSDYKPVVDALRLIYPSPLQSPVPAATLPWQSYNSETEEYTCAQPDEQSYKEYEAMKNYEEKQYVMGVDASTMSLDAYINSILSIEAKIKKLKSVKVKSVQISKMIKQYKADITSIVALMDGKGEK